MARLRKWLWRVSVVVWALVLVLLIAACNCDAVMPPGGIHIGGYRTAIGALLPAEDKARDFSLAWGNAQRAGYVLSIDFTPGIADKGQIELIRTTKWKRTDRCFPLDREDFGPSPQRELFEMSWRPIGFYADRYDAAEGPVDDARSVLRIGATPSRLLYLYLAASAAGLFLTFVGRRLLSAMRRRAAGFEVLPPAESATGKRKNGTQL